MVNDYDKNKHCKSLQTTTIQHASHIRDFAQTSTDGEEIEDEEHTKVLATLPTAQKTVPTWPYLISHNSKYKWRHRGDF